MNGLTKILNEKTIAYWTPSFKRMFLHFFGFGCISKFINKRRFLGFLKRSGYNGEYYIATATIHHSPGERSIRSVISKHSTEELSCCQITLKEIGVFDGVPIYFAEKRLTN